MSEMDHDEWIEDKINKLLNLQVKYENNYDEEIVREYLIYARYNKGHKLIKFFNDNCDDEALFKTLIKILLDESEDFSNDARYSAAYLIPSFNESILHRYKKDLIYAQNYKITNLRPFTNSNIPSWLIK